eukprot:gene28188-34896_t
MDESYPNDGDEYFNYSGQDMDTFANIPPPFYNGEDYTEQSLIPLSVYDWVERVESEEFDLKPEEEEELFRELQPKHSQLPSRLYRPPTNLDLISNKEQFLKKGFNEKRQPHNSPGFFKQVRTDAYERARLDPHVNRQFVQQFGSTVADGGPHSAESPATLSRMPQNRFNLAEQLQHKYAVELRV